MCNKIPPSKYQILSFNEILQFKKSVAYFTVDIPKFRCIIFNKVSSKSGASTPCV